MVLTAYVVGPVAAETRNAWVSRQPHSWTRPVQRAGIDWRLTPEVEGVTMKFRALTAVLALGLGSTFASAGTSLDSLLDGASLTVGGKVFSNFNYQGTGVAASQIQVVTAPGTADGIEFQFKWSSTNGVNEDSVIRYQVHVSDQNLINAVGLHFDGGVTGTNPLTTASVTETINDSDGLQLGKISVIEAGGFPALPTSASFTLSSAARDLFLTKDIAVHSAIESSDVASISLVDNVFAPPGNTPGGGPGPGTSVPLPPALWAALSVLGLGALSPLRRRIRSLITA